MKRYSARHNRGELRQEPITGKWVVIAPDRGNRPRDFAPKDKRPLNSQKFVEDCPFCNLAEYPQEPDVVRLPDDDHNWQVHIFGNKYPALSPGNDFSAWNDGPYRATDAIGYHEILATKHHNLYDFTLTETQWQIEIEALALRFRELKSKPSVSYIQIIKNHGPQAGGSLEHPHNQIFTTPIIPSDIMDMLKGTEAYVKKHRHNPFADILKHEHHDNRRLVYSNEDFTAFCPYASRQPFAITVIPHVAQPSFDQITPSQRASLSEVMRQTFLRLHLALDNVDYNYYVYSAPCDTTGFTCKNNEFPNFRWHIEILPRLNKLGGLEIGTGLEIITMYPEQAAEFLRQQKLS